MYSQAETPRRLSKLIEQAQTQKNIYKPLLFRLNQAEDCKRFEELLATTPNVQVFDTIQEQVAELMRCINPSIVFLPPTELQNAVKQKFSTGPIEEYGVWAYYPWAGKLVHLLDEPEFSIVRTNRNKHKITDKEQALLSTKKIGVMGLSVGQSVSLTLAMERGFGELRIADFDALDLSNINRIRTGVYNIGVPKTVIVAREIAEIDPFLKVVCFHEGITESNINDFLTGNGKLDLLIDECDSFDIKINARKTAKQLGIPVLMEGSDRGTIDIERFDLEKDRPILHGMVEHLDMERYKSLTTLDERVPYITAVTGLETLSPRMKASGVELMATISTWPQLASAVTYGGGITADLSRKILLDQLKISGRFFLDLDELISDPPAIAKAQPLPHASKTPLNSEDFSSFIIKNNLSAKQKESIPLSEQQLLSLIEAAKQAPSGGNNQPWHWHYQDGQLHLFLDESSALAYLDPQFISSYISIGAAIENLLLAASAQHLKVNWHFTPQYAPTHIALFNFYDGHSPSEQELLLEKQISLRHTNRKITPKQEIGAEQFEYLTKLTEQVEGARLKFVTDPEKIKTLAAISTQTDLLRMFIPEAYEDFITREMRWTIDEAKSTEDGIGIHTLDLSNTDQVGIRLLKDERMVRFLQEINGGSGFKRLSMQQFMSSSAIGLISMPAHDAVSLISCGIAAEKLWLGATSLDLKIHPINVPLIFFYKNKVENNLPLPEEIKLQLTGAAQTLNHIFDNVDQQALFMFRIFRANASPERTIRKSTTKILSIGRV
ncbi:Rv1355c family protein [Pedobacter sp. ASV28]|uniref:Rv1355c family protein n=1 Tax=Pedobacter sp. ASV28 TaxID=2795123 RepID=UPI0018EE2CF0|nr:Rv1355c family protein [Pedobacter sp. ASV28]